VMTSATNGIFAASSNARVREREIGGAQFDVVEREQGLVGNSMFYQEGAANQYLHHDRSES
jgi:hypothetical protein